MSRKNDPLKSNPEIEWSAFPGSHRICCEHFWTLRRVHKAPLDQPRVICRRLFQIHRDMGQSINLHGLAHVPVYGLWRPHTAPGTTKNFISSALEFTEWISDLQIFYRPDLDYHPQVGRWAVTDCNPHHEHSCAGGKTQSRVLTTELNLGSILTNLSHRNFRSAKQERNWCQSKLFNAFTSIAHFFMNIDQ